MKSSYGKFVHFANSEVTPLYSVFLLTLYYGHRCCKEHHETYVEDFSLNNDDQGTGYATFEENLTKTRQGGLRKKRRIIHLNMFATGGPRCPVRFFKAILPTDLKKSETEARFISKLLKNRNQKCGARHRGWVSMRSTPS